MALATLGLALLSLHGWSMGFGELLVLISAIGFGAHIIALVTEGGPAAAIADEVIRIPDCDPLVATIPATVALQLLAYHVARLRGCPIDQPRNLAKSVTVE